MEGVKRGVVVVVVVVERRGAQRSEIRVPKGKKIKVTKGKGGNWRDSEKKKKGWALSSKTIKGKKPKPKPKKKYVKNLKLQPRKVLLRIIRAPLKKLKK
jgi:hypothetical protein